MRAFLQFVLEQTLAGRQEAIKEYAMPTVTWQLLPGSYSIAMGMLATLAAAGQVLFNRSRERKTSANDAHRRRKSVARFGLE